MNVPPCRITSRISLVRAGQTRALSGVRLSCSDSIIGSTLGVPEGVEVRRARRRQPDLRRCHCGADRVQPGVASSIAAHEARAVAHWRCGRGCQVLEGFDRDVDHPGLVAEDLDRGLTAREIQRAFLEPHGVVAANCPPVLVSRRRGTRRHGPADRFADVVGAARVIWRERELLLNRTALCGHRHASEREHHEQAGTEPGHADTPDGNMLTARRALHRARVSTSTIAWNAGFGWRWRSQSRG
jgi:hypothetical protein